MVTEQWWRDDVLLLDALAEALCAGAPAPPAVLAAAKAVYTWRTIDAEIAQLAYDSVADGLALAGMRAEQTPLRSLTFAAPGVTIDLGVTPQRLVGHLVPPCARSVEVHVGDRVAEVPIDDLGCFVIEPTPTGAFHLRLHTDSDRVVVTHDLTL